MNGNIERLAISPTFFLLFIVVTLVVLYAVVRRITELRRQFVAVVQEVAMLRQWIEAGEQRARADASVSADKVNRSDDAN